jgi:hypothetical protein
MGFDFWNLLRRLQKFGKGESFIRNNAEDYRLSLKLLPAALQKQDYNLAAHVLVYGLIKASVKKSHNSLKCYGGRKKKQEKE